MTDIRWAIQDLANLKSKKSFLHKKEYSIHNVDIGSLHENTRVGERLELGEYNGHSEKPGLLAEKAKEHWRAGHAMDPICLTIGPMNTISFEDGRHRLVAAYQLGASRIPVFIHKNEVTQVLSILNQAKMSDRLWFLQSTPFKSNFSAEYPPKYTIKWWEHCLSHPREIEYNATKAFDALIKHFGNDVTLAYNKFSNSRWPRDTAGSLLYLHYFLSHLHSAAHVDVWHQFHSILDIKFQTYIEKRQPRRAAVSIASPLWGEHRAV
jgi:hypothetical protein